LRDQVATRLEVQSVGEFRQIAEPGHMNPLEIFVDQDFGPTQKGRELAWVERGVAEESVQVGGELAVSFRHSGRGPLTLPSHN
jgi:hypothetical protein